MTGFTSSHLPRALTPPPTPISTVNSCSQITPESFLQCLHTLSLPSFQDNLILKITMGVGVFLFCCCYWWWWCFFFNESNVFFFVYHSANFNINPIIPSFRVSKSELLIIFCNIKKGNFHPLLFWSFRCTLYTGKKSKVIFVVVNIEIE